MASIGYCNDILIHIEPFSDLDSAVKTNIVPNYNINRPLHRLMFLLFIADNTSLRPPRKMRRCWVLQYMAPQWHDGEEHPGCL